MNRFLLLFALGLVLFVHALDAVVVALAPFTGEDIAYVLVAAPILLAVGLWWRHINGLH